MPQEQKEVNRDKGHAPLFTNQMFDDEEIIGYSKLQIDIAMTTDAFVPLLLHKYASKQSPANDYIGVLRKEFPAGLHTAVDELTAAQVCKRIDSESIFAGLVFDAMQHSAPGSPGPRSLSNITAVC